MDKKRKLVRDIMKILIITGKQAYNKVKKAVKNYDFIDVYMADIQIAAFLTPKRIIKEIKKLEKEKNKKLKDIYDFVLVSGLIRHNLNIVEEETEIPCYKSTREAADLPLLIDNLNSIDLSTEQYADIQIERFIKEKSDKLIINGEKKPLSKGDIKIGNLKVGDSYPMRVLGEIVHVPWLSKKQLEERINYYIENGADMIDLGMVSNEDHSKDIEDIIKFVKDITDKPISIDTLNTKELIEGIKYDVDMILSLDSGNIDELIPYLKDSNTVPVVLPTNYKTNHVPYDINERLRILENNINKLLYNDIKVVGDPILEPINNENFNFTDSVILYKKFKERNNIPLFYGLGNVSELFDGDSNGVNGILSGIAMEVGANILFTPEASSKCKYSIRELKIASKMMYLAKIKNSLPKDLGYDLINYKDKRFDELSTFENYDIPTIIAKEDEKQILDEGSFKIEIDRENKYIVAIYYDNRKNPKYLIKGKKPKEIYETIIRNKLVKRLDHSAYLGKELEKAYIALRIGKKYTQDFELFYNGFWDYR